MPRRRISAMNVSAVNHARRRWLGKCSRSAAVLARHSRFGKRHEQVRIAEIAVVFRDLVLPHEMVAKGVQGEFRQRAMILVQIVAAMGQNERRTIVAFEIFERLLDAGELGRKEAVAEAVHAHRRFAAAERAEKSAGTPLRFGPAFVIAAEDDPAHLRAGPFAEQPQQQSAAADLDVVGMSAEAQEPQIAAAAVETELQHRLAQRRACSSNGSAPSRSRRLAGRGAGTGCAAPSGRRHTIHGASPLACSASSDCRSLNVSMQRQNPS